MSTIIVKNNTGTSVFIEDMGIAVPGSGQRIFSDIFDFTEICVSEELKSLVSNSTFTINNGTTDLTISDALDYLTCKNINTGGVTWSDLEGLMFIQSIDSDPISSTTSTTYQDKLTITIQTSNPAGRYLILCNADFQATNNNKQVGVRLYDKTALKAYSESAQQTNNNTNWFSFANHESIIFNGLAPVTIAVQYRQIDGTTCNIRNCNMSLWRIG